MEFIKYRFIQKLLFAFLLVVPFSCQDPIEGVQVVIDTGKIYDARFTVQFVNLNQSISDAPENLEISFSGKDADKIIDQAGNKNFSPINGLLGLALIDTENISANNPLSFTVIARAEGFSTATKTISVNDLSELSTFNIEMLDKTNLPNGITVQSEQVIIDQATGATQENLSISNTNPGIEESASINLEAGTVFFDENNDPITGGGELEIELIQYDFDEEDAVYSVPGGTGAKEAVDENGNSLGRLQFVPAGFVEINMNVNNQVVRQFGQPIQVGIELDPTTLNPFNNNEPLSLGDIMTVWSINDGASQWQYEGEYQVTENPTTGKLEVLFDVDHLTGFLVSAGGTSNLEACNNDFIFNISSNINPEDGLDATRFVEFVNVATNQIVGSGTANLQNGSSLTFPDPSSSASVKAVIYAGNDRATKGSVIAESSSLSCDNPTTSLSVNLELGTVFSATVTASCASNESVVPQIDATIYLIDDVTGRRIYLGEIIAGKANVTTNKIEVGGTYTFEAVAGEEVRRETLTVSSNSITINIDLPESICSSF